MALLVLLIVVALITFVVVGVSKGAKVFFEVAFKDKPQVPRKDSNVGV